MSRKKDAHTLLSAEENNQIHYLLTHLHEVATTLRQSANQVEAEEALAPIYALSEEAQISLLKTLAKQPDPDGADITNTLYELSRLKEVRKEARRTLIRLEAARIYPQWTPPVTRAPAIQANISHSPRFWKGFVTQAREQGQIQLILSWEQGYDYSDLRATIFLLDFWENGVKEAVVDLMTKRRLDEQIAGLRNDLVDVNLVDCTLAEGKRLLEEALSVNAWRGTAPHPTYRSNQHMINQLIFQATELGTDRGSTFITPELEPEEVVINFLGAWSMGDFGLTYDLLSQNSALHENASRSAWIDLHRQWFDEALPARFQLGFVHEREQNQQSALWLPTPTAANRLTTRKDIEIGWSLELSETPLTGTLKEMALATVVNKETRRHWFWSDYTLMREQGFWRIQSATDEGASVQKLSITELQQRIKDQLEAADKAFNEQNVNKQLELQPDNVSLDLIQELSWRLTTALHLYDALLVRLPLDRTVYQETYAQAASMGNVERAIPYMQRMLDRFPDQRAEYLTMLASALLELRDRQQNRPQLQQQLLTQAEEAVRESLTLKEDTRARLLLADTLLNQQRSAEALEVLQQARPLNNEELSAVQMALGNISLNADQLPIALSYLQKAAEAQPDYPGVHFFLGYVNRQLGNYTEAEEEYRRALRLEPQDERSLVELITLNLAQEKKQEALTLAQQAIQTVPQSARLHALLASIQLDAGNRSAAQRTLATAEHLDPNDELVLSVRSVMQPTTRKQ